MLTAEGGRLYLISDLALVSVAWMRDLPSAYHEICFHFTPASMLALRVVHSHFFSLSLYLSRIIPFSSILVYNSKGRGSSLVCSPTCFPGAKDRPEESRSHVLTPR